MVPTAQATQLEGMYCLHTSSAFSSSKMMTHCSRASSWDVRHALNTCWTSLALFGVSMFPTALSYLGIWV